MLQNPSKYHPNPLSHFLALHNSVNHHNHHHHHHQDQHQQQQSHQGTHFSNHLHHTNQHHNLNGAHFNANGVVNSSLDVGKSFTIAAILGLQKTAIEQHQQNQRDFNSVINLSLNNHHHHQNSNQKNLNNNNLENLNCVNNLNNTNNNINSNNNDNSSGLNNFDCDSVNSVVNRYLPNANNSNNIGNGGGNGNVNLRIASNLTNPFSAVGNSTNGTTPSALQSLQQLHQQHAQQQAANLGFPRDKVKNDHLSAKKSSLKSKRVRTIFTPEQLERLEAEFERQQYMVGPERLYLAHTLQLTEAQVKVWFQNRRIKWRKHHLEITQQRLALIRQTQTITNGEDGGGGGSSAILLNGITNDENDLINGESSAREILDDDVVSQGMMTPNHQNTQQSESDLSICNDSIDGDSIIDGDET